MLPSPGSCLDCAAISRVVRGKDGESATLQNVARLLRAGVCEQHEAFFRQLQELAAGTYVAFPPSEDVPDEETHVRFTREKGGAVRFESSEGSGITGLVFIARDGPHGRSATGSSISRAVDRQWIDLNLLKEWKTTCETSHGVACAPQQHENHYQRPHLPLLIDTVHQCLTTSAAPDASYAALSYIWGQVQTLSPSGPNISQLCVPGAFAQPEYFLPRTIQDAIDVTHALGVRYLWVDAVCLFEDDQETRHALIKNMGAVYAHATFTIVAADGEDANAGLLGIRGLSPRPRDNLCILQGPEGIVLNWPSNDGLGSSYWNLRAWTFQEYVFSRRRLIFVAGSVRWECAEACCWEEHTEDADMPTEESTAAYDTDATYIRKVAGAGPMTFADMVKFNTVVNGFISRQCTYDDDVMDSFSGVLGMLEPNFVGGFMWGAPVMFLDLALLWRGQTNRGYDDEGGRRWDPRQLRDKEHRHAPTWSFMSWMGRLETASQWMNEDWLLYSSTEWFYNVDPVRRVIPLLDWRFRSRPEVDEEPQDIPHLNEWHKMKKRYLVSDPPSPPAGWTRNQMILTEEEPRVSLAQTGIDSPSIGDSHAHTLKMNRDKCPPRYYYTHEATGSAMFLYPLPMRTDNRADEVPGGWDNIRGRYLCASAERCFFKVHVDVDETCQFLYPTSTEDISADHVGRLWPDEALGENGATVSVELVAVSMKYKADGGERWDRPHGEEEPQLYNVLWVEWIDGIAYRKGVGEVDRAAWQSQARDQVEMIIG